MGVASGLAGDPRFGRQLGMGEARCILPGSKCKRTMAVECAEDGVVVYQRTGDGQYAVREVPVRVQHVASRPAQQLRDTSPVNGYT